MVVPTGETVEASLLYREEWTECDDIPAETKVAMVLHKGKGFVFQRSLPSATAADGVFSITTGSGFECSSYTPLEHV